MSATLLRRRGSRSTTIARNAGSSSRRSAVGDSAAAAAAATSSGDAQRHAHALWHDRHVGWTTDRLSNFDLCLLCDTGLNSANNSLQKEETLKTIIHREVLNCCLYCCLLTLAITLPRTSMVQTVLTASLQRS